MPKLLPRIFLKTTKTSRLALYVGLLSLLFTLVSSFGLQYLYLQYSRSQTELRLSAVSSAILEQIDRQMKAASGSGKRIGVRPQTREQWISDAENFLDTFSTMDSMSYSNREGESVWVYPWNDAEIGISFYREPTRKMAVDLAVVTRRPTLTGPIELFSGGLGAALIVPIFRWDRLWGFVGAQFRYEDLFEDVLRQSGITATIRVYDGSRLLYTNNKNNKELLRYKKKVTVLGRQWRIELERRYADVPSFVRELPLVALILGCIISILCSALAYYFEISKENSDKLNLAFESSAIGMLHLDRHGEILQMNLGFAEMLGYRREEIRKRRLEDFTHPEDYSWDLEGRSVQVYDEDPSSHQEKRYLHKDGSYIWAIFTASPLRDSLGNVQHFFVQIQNISSRKQMEDELLEQASELRRSNTQLEQFAYVASHDLQEPLRAVASYVSLLERRYIGVLDERALNYIKHAVEGAQRMQNLINDILTYSKVGTNAITMTKVDCSELVNNLLEDFKALPHYSSATITCDPLPVVDAVPGMLNQVFQNLISNAIKFRGKDQPRIEIKAHIDNNETIFSIKDNGIGIAERHQSKIFGLFERLHSREVYSGTGIGLAICKKVVERHGGRIWLDSKEGVGTTFFFSLPRKKA